MKEIYLVWSCPCFSWPFCFMKHCYFMARGQNETNPAFWLATQLCQHKPILPGRDFPFYPTRKRYFSYDIINPYWPSLFGKITGHSVASSFFPFLWTSTSFRPIKDHQTAKELCLGQYPGHLASRLVINAYRYISHVDLYIGFSQFIYIASLILNWDPEAAVSRIVEYSLYLIKGN